MLGRLSISLAQLKAGNNSVKLKNEIRQLLYYFIVQKSWAKQSITIWSTIFKKWKKSLWTLKIVGEMNLTDLD